MTDQHTDQTPAETLARRFHETYERLAPAHGYQTREASAKPWADVPAQNRSLMVAVAGELLDGPDLATLCAPPVPQLTDAETIRAAAHRLLAAGHDVKHTPRLYRQMFVSIGMSLQMSADEHGAGICTEGDDCGALVIARTLLGEAPRA